MVPIIRITRFWVTVEDHMDLQALTHHCPPRPYTISHISSYNIHSSHH